MEVYILKFFRITNHNNAINIIKRINSGDTLPTFIFNEKYETVFLYISNLQPNEDVGYIYGIVDEKTKTIVFHKIFLAIQYRKVDNIRLVIQKFASLAKQQYQTEFLFLNYTIEDLNNDAYKKIFNKISGFNIVETKALQVKNMYTSIGFDELRKYHWYKPHLLEKKDFIVINWCDLPQDKINALHLAESSNKTENGYLSPFLDESREYDKETSFALIDNKNEELAGWVICQRTLENTIKLRRFFIYKDVRERLVGHSFGTYVLDIISTKVQIMSFEVDESNLQMNKITKKYFDKHCFAKYFNIGLKIKI